MTNQSKAGKEIERIERRLDLIEEHLAFLDEESDQVHDQVRERDQLIEELRTGLEEMRALRNEFSTALSETREMVRLLKRDRTATVARVVHELQGQFNDAVALAPEEPPRRRRRPKGSIPAADQDRSNEPESPRELVLSQDAIESFRQRKVSEQTTRRAQLWSSDGSNP